MEQHNDERAHISPAFQEKWCDQWQASPPMVDSFIFHVPPLTRLPVSARSCSRRSTNDMTNWRGKKHSPDNNDPIQPTVAANVFVQVIMMLRKTFIQDSVLMMELHPCYPIWQHSIVLIQPTCHSKGKLTSWHYNLVACSL
ncbi:hypothetical protein [Absidia glauca]|uniref:Ndc10 domain-containing protein n=1 Tax=Absidia glauca TaxID=4829 RepID=A0A168T1P1_ABSGL|nr:hypothetical protein [Absidia glauca]